MTTDERVQAAREAIPHLEGMMRELLGRGDLKLRFEHADAMRSAQVEALNAVDTILAFAYAVVGRATIEAVEPYERRREQDARVLHDIACMDALCAPVCDDEGGAATHAAPGRFRRAVRAAGRACAYAGLAVPGYVGPPLVTHTGAPSTTDDAPGQTRDHLPVDASPQ